MKYIALFLYLAMSPLALAEARLQFEVLEQATHDKNTFTQGLAWHQGQLFESSGLYDKSFIRRYSENSSEKTIQKNLPEKLFAEGLTLLNDELFLLTWHAGQAMVIEPETLSLKRSIKYQGEGWGLTHQKNTLIMSDGSSTLRFRDPTNFTVLKEITVRNKWREYSGLNELEYAEGAIWANVWRLPYILKIDPQDGTVIGIANLQSLVDQNSEIPGHTVLNGIAYDPQRKAFWVTGKFWPTRYLVRFNIAPHSDKRP